jgi:hypothetical protein
MVEQHNRKTPLITHISIDYDISSVNLNLCNLSAARQVCGEK